MTENEKLSQAQRDYDNQQPPEYYDQNEEIFTPKEANEFYRGVKCNEGGKT